MKIQLNSINFYDDISPQEEIIDSMDNSARLIPIGRTGIHIKKENRGKFTSYCGGKVTDACIQKGKNSSDPAVRKRATFADNARKWKHQQGGILMPGIDQDISQLFVDVPDPTPYQKKQEENNLFIKDEIVQPTSQTQQSIDTESIVDPDDDLGGGEFVNDTPITTTPQPTITQSNKFSVRRLDFNAAQMNDNLRSLLQPYIGIQSSGWGHFDCSDFVRHVYKNLTGNSRSIYKQVTPINNRADLKPGDLVFLKGTNSHVPSNLVSHVAIVTNTDRLGEGIIQIAQGSPNKVTGIREWNLNDKYFDTHWFGGGRLKTPSAKLGMKFQNGGYFIGSVPNFIKPNKQNFQIPYIVDQIPPVSSTSQQTTQTSQKILPDWFTTPYNPPKKQEQKQEVNYSTAPGYRQFKQCWDEYVKIDPDAKRFEKVLTDIAQHESNFNPQTQNRAGAPAFGYFQFWQDGKINNITHYSGLNISEFLNNPQVQIAAAVKMARNIVNSFNSQDLKMAQSLGYSMESLIRGAWLGGVSGVRKVLRGIGNPSDNKWYGGKGGRTVKQAMDEQNNLI